MLGTYQQYAYPFKAPKIETFYPFQGGTPVKISSSAGSEDSITFNNVIEVDFAKLK